MGKAGFEALRGFSQAFLTGYVALLAYRKRLLVKLVTYR